MRNTSPRIWFNKKKIRQKLVILADDQADDQRPISDMNITDLKYDIAHRVLSQDPPPPLPSVGGLVSSESA
jgi:hypothetical protein